MNSSHPMVARSGEDLLAMLPVLFGFQPDHSLVLLGLSPDRPFHARVDLGETRQDVVEALDLLCAPARRHGATRVVVLVLVDLEAAERWRGEIAAACHGLEVVEVVVADGRRWRPLGSKQAPREYDVWSHPFVAQAVLEGRVLLPSRAALVDSLAAVPAQVRPVRQRLACGAGRPLSAVAVRKATHELAGRAGQPDPEQVAAWLVAVRDPEVCLALVEETCRTDARALLPVWTTVLRSAPAGWVAPAAGVVAFLAWLAGDGARAWVAVDRARAAGETGALVRLVVPLLEGAVPPDAWEDLVRGRRGGGEVSEPGVA